LLTQSPDPEDLFKQYQHGIQKAIDLASNPQAAKKDLTQQTILDPESQTQPLQPYLIDPAMFGDSTYFKLLNADYSATTEFLRNDNEFLAKIEGHDLLYLNRYISNIAVDDQLAFLYDLNHIAGYAPDKIVYDQFVEGVNPNIENMRQQIADGIAHPDYFLPASPRMFAPRVVGAPNNPYYRYRLAQSKASHEMAKLDDLPVVNSIINLVLTYPREISHLVFKYGLYEMETRCNECYKDFWMQLHEMTTVVKGKQTQWIQPVADVDGLKKRKAGCSQTLHPWSSSNPLAPHFHHHVIMPNIAVVWDYAGSNIHSRNIRDMRSEIDTYLKDTRRELEMILSENKNTIKDGIVIETTLQDANLFSRSVKQIIDTYDKELAEQLEMTSLPWVDHDGKLVPFPVDDVKRLWTDCVKQHFGMEFDPDFFKDLILDVHVKYSYKHKRNFRSQVLHWLAYKSRDPVQDLNIFFKYNPGVVSPIMDPSAAAVDYNLDITKIRDELLFERVNGVPDDHLKKWLADIVAYKSKTKVYGFWKYLKSFLRDITISIHDKINPITGRPMQWLCTSNDPIDICYIIEEINSSRFLCYSKPG